MTPRVMFAAGSSSSGKTTAACAVLRALSNLGQTIAPFKCGPDYIDPMFLKSAARSGHANNLDLYFSNERTVCEILAGNAQTADFALLEGVMGYYDGLAGISDAASSYDVARATKTPVILVVSCRGMSVSIAAQVKGFLDFRADSNIAGVILNNLPASSYPGLKELILRECGIPCVGYLPPMPHCAFESRHLGLVTADEAAHLEETFESLAAQVQQSIDLDLLRQIAETAPPLSAPLAQGPKEPLVRIAVARDTAFCFYYEESMQLLRELGAELIPFSPLRDAGLPEDIDGLILGGGYPELHAKQLSSNTSMLKSVHSAVSGGLPTIAECGGFLYLHKTLEDKEGAAFPMAGVIDAEAYRTTRLGRFGYIELTACKGNLLASAGGSMRAHEFHYWDSRSPGSDYQAEKPVRGTKWDCIHASETLFVGFPHLYLAGNRQAAERFVSAACSYRKGRVL